MERNNNNYNNAKGSIYLCYNKNQPWGGSSCHHVDDDIVCEDLYYHHHDDHNDDDDDDDGMMMMMTWPPRSYTCSFCKREFKSAQALGGHMNVHRRDRAQLRQQITNPPLNLNLNLPPNPNYNHRLMIQLPKKIQPPPPSPPPRMVAHDVITRKQFECFRRKNNLKKGGGIIRVDLEMDIKEDLDLELRLGYN